MPDWLKMFGCVVEQAKASKVDVEVVREEWNDTKTEPGLKSKP